MKGFFKMLIVVVLSLLAGGMMYKCQNDRASPWDAIIEETEETSIDTTSHIAPIAVSEVATGRLLYTLPVYRFIGTGTGGEPRQCVDAIKEGYIERPDSSLIRVYGTGSGGEPRSISRDSAIVELPIIQRHYADSTYEAWVSGPVDPKLDGLKVYARTRTITQREWKPPKKWHIGVTAGYGYSSAGLTPYIGVGVTYSIISF